MFIHNMVGANKVSECAHNELTPDDLRTKVWLRPNSPAHEALKNLFFLTRNCCQTLKNTLSFAILGN